MSNPWSAQDYVALILAIFFFGLILFIGLKTDILKESKDGQQPYSFRKFQLWIWTLIIAPCFVLNWGFGTAPPNTILPYLNLTALVLLGISSVTTLTAEVISSTQEANRTAMLAKGANPPSLKALNVPSTNFWSDILKDDSGQFSVLRLQQLLFTFAYVGIYVTMFFTVDKTGKDSIMSYPDFDTNAFILMGISSGTYLVGKGLNK